MLRCSLPALLLVVEGAILDVSQITFNAYRLTFTGATVPHLEDPDSTNITSTSSAISPQGVNSVVTLTVSNEMDYNNVQRAVQGDGSGTNAFFTVPTWRHTYLQRTSCCRESAPPSKEPDSVYQLYRPRLTVAADRSSVTIAAARVGLQCTYALLDSVLLVLDDAASYACADGGANSSTCEYTRSVPLPASWDVNATIHACGLVSDESEACSDVTGADGYMPPSPPTPPSTPPAPPSRPPSPANPSPSPSSFFSELSDGAIAGTVVGVVVGVALLIGLGLLTRRKCCRGPPPPPDFTPSGVVLMNKSGGSA